MSNAPLVRTLRAALFHVRAVIVFLAITSGIIAWLLAGVLFGLVLRPFRTRAARLRTTRSASDPGERAWSLPTWLQAQ